MGPVKFMPHDDENQQLYMHTLPVFRMSLSIDLMSALSLLIAVSLKMPRPVT